MSRHYFASDDPYHLPPEKLEELAEILDGTDDDLFVALTEAGVDADGGDIVTLAGNLPGLPVRQCRDCGFWHRGRKCQDCLKVKTP